jgi:hypothetical protein
MPAGNCGVEVGVMVAVEMGGGVKVDVGAFVSVGGKGVTAGEQENKTRANRGRDVSVLVFITSPNCWLQRIK